MEEKICVSSTKLDFSVGSFDFRLQVEADHHGSTKHTRACLRLNLISVWDHLILDCRWGQTTTEQQDTHTLGRPPRSNKTHSSEDLSEASFKSTPGPRHIGSHEKK